MSEDENKKKLISRRGILKSQLTRFTNFVQDDSNREKTTEIYSRLQKVETLFDQFNDLQDEIEIIDDSDEQCNYRIDFENKYFFAVAEARKILDTEYRAKSSQNNPNVEFQSRAPDVSPSKQVIQLPPVALPEFDGTYERWPTFRDIFNSLIHTNQNLSNVEKFYYLKGCLRGDSSHVIDSLVINDANYTEAWKLLVERYDNKKYIIKGHMKQIFELPNVSKGSYISLRIFFDNFQKHFRALKILNEPVDSWDTILLYLLSSKLDPFSKREWEIKTKDEDSPTIGDFVKFLKDRCHLLESTDSKVDNKPISKTLTHPSLNQSQNKQPCLYCNGEHSIYFCKEFIKLSVSSRWHEIKKIKACTNCLQIGHKPNDCKMGLCRHCNRKHNSLLHFNNTEVQQSNKSQSPSTALSQGQTFSHSQTEVFLDTQNLNHTPINSQVYSRSNTDNANFQNQNASTTVTYCSNGAFTILSTALVYIYDGQNKSIKCRALLDSGSQSNFITQDLQNRLKIKPNKINMSVLGINSAVSNVTQTVKTKIKSTVSNHEFDLQFLIIDKITDNIPQITFNISGLQIPKNIILADPYFNHSSKIDILLGANVFYQLLQSDQIKFGRNQPILQNTKLGYVVSGPFREILQENSNCFLLQNSNLENQLESFWRIEELPIKQQTFSKEEQECEQHFLETFQRDKLGKFVVRLPFKDNFADLGDSRQMAIRRFQTLETKLSKNLELKEEYSQFMLEYLGLGHMSPLNIESEPTNKSNFYLPHHSVSKASSLTTKLRVVFDASAKSNTNLSLNDVLKVGPCIQEPIFWILLRFRVPEIVFTADITKMYRCIDVQREDRDYQRIVWRSDPSHKLNDYELCTVTYGTSPASFLATRCLKQLAFDNQSKFPNASHSIMYNFYMDDWLDGADDIKAALCLVHEVDQILSSAGFHLRQWTSNDKRILNTFQDQSNLNNTQYIVKDQSSKTLGVMWDSSNDIFQYVINPDIHKIVTKRKMLSVISQIFDPLGLIGPIIIIAKMLLQRLWQSKVGWDDPISPELNIDWLKFVNKLEFLKKINIPRHVLLETPTKVELHCFSDASQTAYGSAIYIRSTNQNGDILVKLACAKSRVAPLKVITLPRLELCGALMSAKLCKTVIDALKIRIDNVNFWCDSTIVLAWIATDSSKLKTFVSNRIAQIQTLSDPLKWRYVPTDSNPADLISRGIEPDDHKNLQFWFDGPRWLSLCDSLWPKLTQNINNFELPEVKSNTQLLISTNYSDNEVILRFSSLTKLIRVVALMLRFVKNIKTEPKQRIFGKLSIQETIQSTQKIVQVIQAQVFPDELKCLKDSRPVQRNSKLLRLDPFLDENNIIRVGGRLKHSLLNFDSKHPIILPSNHHFTILVVRNEHLKNLHAGPQTVLSNLRLKYWPLQGRQIVRSVLRKCVTCFRANPPQIIQKMSDLPEARVTPSPPFSVCGIDYAGPYLIKDSKFRNKKLIKAYICLFICFTTKAIHLELVSELSTEGFLNMFKRFIARRGLCTDVYSDNATNFIGADKSLSEVVNHVSEPAFQGFLLENKIHWHFIPPRSPHFGGLWESAVRLTKHHLKRLIFNLNLTYEDFYTVLVQVESIVNSRPLIPLTEMPEDLDVLTPGHFLIGRSLLALPENPVPDNRHTYTSRYKHMQFLIQQFWAKWSRDYLQTLQQRSQWQTRSKTLFIVGTLVILKEDNSFPMDWKLGRIIETYPGKDGLVRVVLVKTSTGVFKRAVTKICVLPIDINKDSSA